MKDGRRVGVTKHQGVTRRSLLQAAGTVLIGGTVAADRARAAPKKARGAGALSSRYDVIVIGGGFAGATASRDLVKYGYGTLLLEARNRLGGRTFTSQFSGEQVELGGGWVHWSQGYVWGEMTRYGLSVSESPGFSAETASWLSRGAAKNATSEEYITLVNAGLSKFSNVDGQEGRTILPRPHDCFFNETAVVKFDDLSIRDRLSQISLDDDQRDVLDANLTVIAHSDPADAAFMDALRWWALGDFEAVRMFDRLGRFKIKEGMRTLIQSMIDDAKPDVSLATPVKAVQHASDSVRVTTVDGHEFTSRALVVAVPMNVLDTIPFSPPLSPGKLAAAREKHAARGTKCYILVKEKLGNWLGAAPFPHPITMAWTEGERPDGTMLVAFGPPQKMDIANDREVERALRALLPQANVTAVMGYQWENDPYAKGTWCVYRPRQMTQRFHDLQKKEGNCFFASADSANGWRGFVDGAIESGIRAARDVRKALQ